MPVIAEEDETIMADMDIDVDDLLALPSAAYGVGDQSVTNGDDFGGSGLPNAVCPSHPDGHNCLCHGFMGDWDVLPTAPKPLHEDYGKFEDWIPRFIQPEKACDYCRSKGLNCHLSQGDAICRPCASLFRECSLSKSNTLEASNYAKSRHGEYFDTLHMVHENVCAEQGTLTGIKPLHSKGGRRSGTSTPYEDDEPGSSRRNGIRFPRHAVKVLREWLDVHQDHPYPNDEERTILESQTELTQTQIANWLANARRRKKATQRAKPKLCMSPSLRPTAAIDIPEPDKPWEELNPLERWKHSPPENEPARFTDIASAVEHGDLSDDATSPSSYNTRRRKGSSNGSKSKAPSTTSQETSLGSSLSAVSSGANSRGSNGSFGSFSSSLAGKRDRRRRRRPGTAGGRPSADLSKRIFQCTFCTDSFKSKYDWTRHEKSLHLSLEKWLCAPLGPFIVEKTSGEKSCVYCGMLNPPDGHGETHNHSACEEKGLDARTFYRKDHLRQHLRLMHNCEMMPSMLAWNSVATNINSRCGFCAQRFTVWQERVDHLTAHFKAGVRMASWKGCRGLDPAVAAQVTNAMPPYLIGVEAVSPNPFSATNRDTNLFPVTATDHPGEQLIDAAQRDALCMHFESGSRDTAGTKATCWEILTVRLGKYANDMIAKGVVITDEMLESQSRWILYGSDDTWNQTACDNPEWRDLFKKAHGLDFIPKAIGGQGKQVPEDLETYSDLGMRIPFNVQLEAYNKSKIESGTWMDGRRHQQVRYLYNQLSKEGVLHDTNSRCSHAECERNIVDTRRFDRSGESSPATRRWCTYELPPEKAKQFAILTAPAEESIAISHALMQPRQADLELQAAHDLHSCIRGLQTADKHALSKVMTNVSSPSKRKSKSPELQHSTGVTHPAQRAFDALTRADCLDHNKHSCGGAGSSRYAVKGPSDFGSADKTRWDWLQKLQDGETACCPHVDHNARTFETRARQLEANRARGMATLTSLEQNEPDDHCGPNDVPLMEPKSRNNRGFVPRHHYALPADKARRFATLTGAWEDSGSMPPATSTADLSLPSIMSPDTTSTGAMMEFLGGDFGAHLDFSQDAATSLIPLPQSQQQGPSSTTQSVVEMQEGYPYPALGAESDLPLLRDPHDWYNGTDHWVDESVLLRDIDDLIAASQPGVQQPLPAFDGLVTSGLAQDSIPAFGDFTSMPMASDSTAAVAGAPEQDLPLTWTDADFAALAAGDFMVDTSEMMGPSVPQDDQAMKMADLGGDMEFEGVFDFEQFSGTT
nr:hypothetical protein B0A51_09458 [Rachicladosporium sp. CCFEE 5018]